MSDPKVGSASRYLVKSIDELRFGAPHVYLVLWGICQADQGGRN